MQQKSKRFLTVIGALMVIYAVLVLGFVATSPDVRLRCLLVEEQVDISQQAESGGVRIQATHGLESKGSRPPEPGDLLVRLNDEPIRTFLDFTRQLINLHNASIPPGGQLDDGADPSELADAFSLPSLVKVGDSLRMVKVEFQKPGSSTIQTNWLAIQSLPMGEVVLTFVWFILHLGILVVGAFAYWNRPFDRPVRMFFVMCVVTVGAFVGGYHWWVLAGSLWLNLPFAISAILLPAVTLHFFLVYPRPKFVINRWPKLTITALYAAPVLAITAVLTLLVYSRWLNFGEQAEQNVPLILETLRLLRQVIYVYLGLAGLYFFLTLVVLVYSFATTRNPVERSQVKWILVAALIAMTPISYTLYLAHVDRVGFALGRARIPMFLASLSFMLAYAIGILRYKLMLVDQIVSKGMLYYAVSSGLTMFFATTVAFGSVVPQFMHITLTPVQSFTVFAILILSIVLMLCLRDHFQQVIDRQFFREKYQLDKALQRMNRAVGHLVDRESLAALMLGSCRDVLRVERAAFYLRNSLNGPFQLIATEGIENIPLQFSADPAFIDTLTRDGSLLRVTPGTRSEMSPVQNLLRKLQAELISALEVGGNIAGLVVLGEKKNGTSFTAEDLTFLNAMGQITNVAMHSAKVHQDITRLNEELRLKMERIAEQRRQITMLQAELTSSQLNDLSHSAPSGESVFRRDAIKGNSPAIRRVLETVRKVASSESSVLLRGESGTGKELLAQVLHDNSPRCDGPMIRVHCASLSAGLLESELFGHTKGAFTGAHQNKIGRFEAANGGTLFLDEIGDISLETQIKLLRVLQERCFEPVGSTNTIHVDVRLITATHQNLEKLISEGRFREDLYYRLNVISITLPPLRERQDDLLELSIHFLNRAAARLGKRITHIDEEALAALERHAWPGNIRELENVIERAVVLTESDKITLNDLPAEVSQSRFDSPRHLIETKPLVPELISTSSIGRPADKSFEKNSTSLQGSALNEPEILEEALRKTGGNKTKAAELLGMPRSTYYSKLKKFNIG